MNYLRLGTSGPARNHCIGRPRQFSMSRLLLGLKRLEILHEGVLALHCGIENRLAWSLHSPEQH
jgi:hypothetical protein